MPSEYCTYCPPPQMLCSLSASGLGTIHYNIVKSMKTGNSPINPCLPQVSLVSCSEDLKFIDPVSQNAWENESPSWVAWELFPGPNCTLVKPQAASANSQLTGIHLCSPFYAAVSLIGLRSCSWLWFLWTLGQVTTMNLCLFFSCSGNSFLIHFFTYQAILSSLLHAGGRV